MKNRFKFLPIRSFEAYIQIVYLHLFLLYILNANFKVQISLEILIILLYVGTLS